MPDVENKISRDKNRTFFFKHAEKQQTGKQSFVNLVKNLTFPISVFKYLKTDIMIKTKELMDLLIQQKIQQS